MKREFFLYCVIILSVSVICVNGQNPTPTPYLGRPETGVERVRRLDEADARIRQQAYENLYGRGNVDTKSSRYSPEWRARMVALYRKPKDEETEILKPAGQLMQKYADFLRDNETGIFKLIPEMGCDGDGDTVNASPDCLKYNFPGAGSSYSFRLKSYRIRRLADITLVKNSLTTRGIFNGAIFVAIGDVPIEAVNLKTPGLAFLQEYKPVKTAGEALEAAKLFAGGVKKDGHIYGRGIFATENNTFAMRLIAYDGTFQRAEAGVVYNELDFDKRRDIIVAFRIVEVETDGSATIVWKILQESKAPKLKVQ